MSYYGTAQQGGWADVWTGIKEVGKVVIGGALANWGTGMMGEDQRIPQPQVIRTPPQPYAPPYPVMPGGSPVGLGPQQFLPARVPGQGRLPPFTATGPGVLPMGGIQGFGAPRGYHLAKDGSGKLVRNRRMNIANPRALRRAMRRVQGFEKLARRTISFTRRVKMKKRKAPC